MGNPQFNQRGKQSLLLRPPFRGAPRREMNFLPVPLTSFDGGESFFIGVNIYLYFMTKRCSFSFPFHPIQYNWHL